mgnify:CR=1 FL=1
MINEDKQKLLQKRAEILARPPEKDVLQKGMKNLLVFILMGKRYALPLINIVAVTRIQEITSIPSAPRHIPGIIRRRGESIGLVNLAYFFNAERSGISDSDFAVIVNAARMRFALQVEDIVGALTVKESDLFSPQGNFDPAQIPYVSSVMLDGLVVLDLESLTQAKGFVAEKSI